MQVPTKDIRNAIKALLIQRVEILKQHGIKPTVATMLVGTSPEQESYVAIKERTAQSLGINFIFDRIPPDETALRNRLHNHIVDENIHGIIVQQPLPAPLTSFPVYDIIPAKKDIEGHTIASPYLQPIGLAVLTTLKWRVTQTIDKNICFEPEQLPLLQPFLRDKTIVIAGRGITGGKPIASLFDHFTIPYTLVSSETDYPDVHYKTADIIITAVGKSIINQNNIKNGVVLLNVGLHEEDGTLVGDFHEESIKDIASWYTPTPGGIGPLDVLFLYHNLILAAEHL